jgi:hypothetical protein
MTHKKLLRTSCTAQAAPARTGLSASACRRPALRLYAAYRLHHGNAPYERLTDCIQQLESQWSSLQRYLRDISYSIRHGWHAAAKNRCDESRFDRHDFQETFRQTAEAMTRVSDGNKPGECTPQDIFQDLMMLEEEFRRVQWTKHEIFVTTKPISLEGIYLGPFEIHLPYASVGKAPGNQSFHVIATDPHPSAKREDVVHPHVDGTALCTGDAVEPIGRALAEGRIGDFFMIVRSVLETYNEESPYVRLDQWEGGSDIECEDCGCCVHEDNASSCQRCLRWFCEDYGYGCNQCGDSICGGCSRTCSICDSRSCRTTCMRNCPQCEDLICRGCANDQGLCESCQEEQSQKGDLDHDPEDESTPGFAPAGGPGSSKEVSAEPIVAAG